MDLRELEDGIFDKYRSLREQIIPDGAIGLEYKTARPRVLVILKEANDVGGEWAASGGDLRGFGDWGGRSATWRNLARWSALCANSLLQFHEIDVSTRQFRAVHLRRIAVVNLKKTPGGSRASSTVIEKYAIKHQELLNEQFELYRPDLSLAAGTFEILVKLRGKEKSATPMRDNCFPHFADDDLGLCIDFYHPQQRKFTDQCLFDFLTQQLQCHGFAR